MSKYLGYTAVYSKLKCISFLHENILGPVVQNIISLTLSLLNFRRHCIVCCFLFFFFFQTNYCLEKKKRLYIKLKDWTSNSVDPDETAHYEPSHLDLCCLQKPVTIAYGSERVKELVNGKLTVVAKEFWNTLIFLLQKLLKFFQQKISMFLPYFRIEILMSH